VQTSREGLRSQPQVGVPFDGEDRAELEKNERAIRSIFRRARKAREEPVAFFEFAMREEKTGARLVAAAHQRVLYSFVMHHPQCVLRNPVGSSKTYSLATLSLWLLGNDPTERGAIISASQDQAKKPLSMVQDYIENENAAYPELALIFPELRPSHRSKDPWQQNKIVVERRAGIRDASLTAIGYGGKLPGSRLSWILVDDLLSEENTSTASSRAKVNRWFMMTVLSRKDIEKSRIVVSNTPYNAGSSRDTGDLTYMLERSGWPTMTMDIEGDITITNAADDWDCDDIRPSFWGKHPDTNPKKGVEVYRLSAHDSEEYGAPAVVVDAHTGRERRALEREVNFAAGTKQQLKHYDVDETVPLWPEKYGLKEIEKLRVDFREQFSPLYKCKCRDDETAMCKLAWIELCKKRAYEFGIERLVTEYRGQNPTITGIDLAFGIDETHDWTCFVTLELIPSITIGERTYRNVRRILDVDYKRLEGTDVRDLALEKRRRYRSFLKVETNAGQKLLLDMLLEKDVSCPVLSHTTGMNKHHRHLGVVGVFSELKNGGWLIPSDASGQVDENVQRWIDGCLGYAPAKHADDGLMASWIARSFAIDFDGALATDNTGAEEIASSIAQR
jgi:hypothetical protein